VDSRASEALLQENLKRYARFDPQAALAIARADSSPYRFCLTKKGELNLEKGGRLLCSPEGAFDEAVVWRGRLPLKATQGLFVFGVGLGYNYFALKSWLREKRSRYLIFLEDDLSLLRRFFETKNAAELLSDPQAMVCLFSFADKDKQGGLGRLNPLFFYLEKERIFLSLQGSYWKRRREDFYRLKMRLHAAVDYAKLSYNEFFFFHKQIYGNFYANMLRLNRVYSGPELYGKFASVPAVICGAGPSIVGQIPLLKTLADRAVIFGSGSAMNVLNNRSFFPHFGVGLDPTVYQASRIKGNFAYETPYFFRARFNSEAFKMVHGPKLYCRGFGGQKIAEWFDRELKTDREKELPHGYSSTNFCLELAAALGCNPIILVGFDLAYTRASRYAEGVAPHPTDSMDERTEIVHQDDVKLEAKGTGGEPLLTKMTWVREAGVVRRFQKENPKIRLINATEEGLSIDGVEHRPLSETIEPFLFRFWDLSGKIHALTQNSPRPLVPEERCQKTMREWQESLKRCRLLHEELARTVSSGSEEAIDRLAEKIRAEPAWEYGLSSWSPYTGRDLFPERNLLFCHSDLLTEEERLRMKRILYRKEAQFFLDICRHEERLCEKALEAQLPGKQEKIEAASAGFTRPPFPEGAEVRREYYSGGELFSETCYLEGRRHGPSLFYAITGVALSLAFFKEGKEEGETRRFYASGALQALLHYKAGLFEGEQLYYYERGVVKSRIPFQNGRLHGVVRLYYPDGGLKRELHFSEGRRHGGERFWDEAGNLRYEAEFKEGSPHGKAAVFSAEGKKVRELFFRTPELFDIREWNEKGELVLEREGRPEKAETKKKRKEKELYKAVYEFERELNQLRSLSPKEREEWFW